MSVLAVVEGYAAALASTHLDTAGMKHLREINASMHSALRSGDIPAFSRLNREFHFFIYDRCQNSYLVDLLRETWDRLEVRGHTDFSYIPQRSWVSIEEHTQLLNMIERHASQDEIEHRFLNHKLRPYDPYRTTPPSLPHSTA